MKKAITIRVSQLAYEKLLQLAKLHGTQTEAIAFAIENLWQKEIGVKVIDFEKEDYMVKVIDFEKK